MKIMHKLLKKILWTTALWRTKENLLSLGQVLVGQMCAGWQSQPATTGEVWLERANDVMSIFDSIYSENYPKYKLLRIWTGLMLLKVSWYVVVVMIYLWPQWRPCTNIQIADSMPLVGLLSDQQLGTRGVRSRSRGKNSTRSDEVSLTMKNEHVADVNNESDFSIHSGDEVQGRPPW